MTDNNNSSGVNTVLLVILLLIAVGFGVWWFSRTPTDQKDGIKIDIPLGGSPRPSGQ